jgi:hypothetical protein
MEQITSAYVRQIGARRKALLDDLKELDGELKAILPRIRGHMTQEDIGDACGISLPTVRAWSRK